MDLLFSSISFCSTYFKILVFGIVELVEMVHFFKLEKVNK